MFKSPNGRYLTLIIVGLLSFLSLFIYLMEVLTHNGSFVLPSFLLNLSVSIIFMGLVVFTDYKLVIWLNSEDWFRNRFLLRLIFEIICLSSIATLFVFLGNLPFLQEFSIYDYITSTIFFHSVIGAILLNVFTITVIELYVQNERHQYLQRDNLRMQHLQLKSQINPHFLFNSLNVLVSLINKDRQRAVFYTKKLSEVYRYVLSHDVEETVIVSEELNFIRTYIEILQIRYGSVFEVHFDILPSDENRLIPPMTLQLLIENAVKHNSLIASNPLMIRILSNGDELIISNSLESRLRVESSLGIGLANLKAKYSLLTEKMISVEKTDTQFTVKLPLL